jgi:hypothetical protein
MTVCGYSDTCNPTWTKVPVISYDANNTNVDVRFSIYDADDDGVVESDRLIGSYDTTIRALINAANGSTSLSAELVNTSNSKVHRLITSRKSTIHIKPTLTSDDTSLLSVTSPSTSRVVKHKAAELDATFVVFYRTSSFESGPAYQTSMSFFCEDMTLFWSAPETRRKTYAPINVSSTSGSDMKSHFEAGSVPLTSITGVLIGKQKSVFDNASQPGVSPSNDGKGVRRAVEEHSFTLLTTTRQIDIEAKSVEERTKWLSSLQSLLRSVGRESQFVSRLHITEELAGVGQGMSR